MEDSRVKRKDALPPATTKEVLNFFESGAVSHDLPDAQGADVENGVVNCNATVMWSNMASCYLALLTNIKHKLSKS